MRTKTRPLGVAAVAIAGLAVAGYGASAAPNPAHDPSTAPPDSTVPTEGTEMEMMDPPEFATDWAVEVTSDAEGEVVTANEVELNVAPVGFEMSCDWAGKENTEEFGHYHVLIDGSLVDMSCEETFVLSMQNVAPGEHEIGVAAALNDHVEVLANEVFVEFTYEPSDPLPEITDQEFEGEPTIRIVSPEDGDTVSGTFDVVYEVENLELSCDLFGKPSLFGWGHAHVNADTMTGPMMGMLTMFGMACTDTFQASTVGYEPGETHAIIALLTDNGHAPLTNPEAADSVEVTIGESDSAETTTGEVSTETTTGEVSTETTTGE